MNFFFLDTTLYLNFKENVERWCGNVNSTSERNYQTFNKLQAKAFLAAMLEGKSMPSNMSVNTNHATLLINESAIKYLP